MDTKPIINLIEKNFENITYPKEQIIRSEYLYGGRKKLVSINYFDFSQKVLSKEFDLDEYQTDLLAKDYYKHVGYPQWSFYLYFICEKIDDSLKTRIENDDKYTRKRILTFENLRQLLNARLDFSAELDADITEDISITWIKKLKESQLDGVYLDALYTEVVKKYIEGDPIKDKSAAIETGIEVEKKLGFISKLKLEKYRPFPKDNEFIFEKINLIKGANGSGKTSLLEAIELCLCGKTFRNEDKDASSKISLIYVDGRQDELERNNRKFQARDLFWYGNSYPRGNYLPWSFHKYNFYDSDAAYRLAQSNNPKEIIDAFLSLALGKKANYIDDRLSKILERFEDANKAYEREHESIQALKKSQEKTLQNILEAKDDSLAYFESFVSFAKKLNWRGALPKTPDDSWISFENELSSLEVVLETITSKIEWLCPISLVSIKQESEKINLVLGTINKFMIEIKDKNKKVENLNVSLNSLLKMQDVFAKIEPYINEKQLELLDGLQLNLDKLTKEKERFSLAIQLSKDLDLSSLNGEKITLGECEESQLKQQRILKEQIKDILSKIEGVKLTFNKLDGIVKEIKAKGLEFLAANPDALNCPLCEAKYEANELSNRIKETKKTLKNSQVLEDLLNKQASLNNEIERIKNNLKFIVRIKEISSVLFESREYSKINFGSLIKEISNIDESLLSTENKISELLTIKNKLLAKGLDEQTFLKLREEASGRGLKLDLSYANRKEIIRLKNEVDLNIKTAKEKLNNEIPILQGLTRKRDEVFRDYFKDIEYRDTLFSELEKRAESIKQVLGYYGQLSSAIDASPDKEIDKISIALQKLKKIFFNFKNTATEKKENILLVRECKKNIDEYDKKLKILEPKRKHTVDAIGSIEHILREYNKEKYFDNFFRENKKFIVDIFRNIHSPLEFFSIELSNTDDSNKIVLGRGEKNESTPLTQISSGQRSALFISIFLALNRQLKNGPPFIIFDDPVAHVDDMNVLSFLDYLRDITLYGNKQIFFATASEKISNLFQKKFEFFETDFKIIELDR